MSELSELIKTAKNIESQNAEIIRLLKKIAGEQTESLDAEISRKFMDSIMAGFSAEGIVLDDESDDGGVVGEVYFIEGTDVFKLTVQNNESSIDNLTSSSEPHDFNLQEMIANESARQNQSLATNTVILNESQTQNLSETLELCIDKGMEIVYLPLSEAKQLMWTLDAVRTKIDVEFYKSPDHLIEIIFG